MKRLLPLLAVLILGLPLCGRSVRADVPASPTAFTWSAGSPTSATGTIGPFSCANANTGTFTFTTGGGAAYTVQTAADGPYSAAYATDASFGTAGVITAPGANTQSSGALGGTAVLYVRATYTGNSGTIAGTFTCSGSITAGSGSGGGGSVTQGTIPWVVSLPTNQPVACISGCAGSATIPPENSTPILPAATSLPVIGQNYWWNGVNWIADSASSPMPAIVNTPAPCATPTCASVVYQGTSPWVVNTAAPGAAATPSSGPLPTASAGAAVPALAPYSFDYLACFVPAGATPNATGGNAIAVQCDSNGAMDVDIPNPSATIPVHDSAPVQPSPLYTQPVTTPAPVGTIGVVQQAAPLATTPVSTPSSAPLPTATTGAAVPTQGVNESAYLNCIFSGIAASPNVTGANAISAQCDKNGDFYVNTNTTSTLNVGTSGAGLPAPINLCSLSATISIAATAGTTQLVGLVAGQKVRICSFSVYIVSGTLPSFSFLYGTGAACVTGPVQLTGTYGGIAAAIGEHITVGNGIGQLFQTPNSQEFCITAGGTTPTLAGFITYGQY
jgi:hypothetical protein